ncbi:MAG: cupin domain-containing protein [Alphaproteobacteria bacterium]|nr:cupin domain-containing protein [Alphaproteobacteria bacterium]
MNDIGSRPWDGQYEIKNTTIIAETMDLRALHVTLAAGDVIPWHFHSQVTENFTCAKGALVVESRAPREEHRLQPGERLTLEPKTAHRVSNGGDSDCCFVLVQGIGAYDYTPVGG